MNIYIGNLDYNVKDAQLQELFAQFGAVTSVKVITDKMTGRSKGFAFVEMQNDEDAARAISELNGKPIKERQITVSEAKPKEEKREFKPRRSFNNNNNNRY
ncbi:MAG: RNA-binding protein [Bacteroidetes bacterium]|nr:RNA-binding protein [Bacteroidota bacterium]